MEQETAVPIINGIVESLGGTSDATTIVPALKELAEVIGSGIVDPEAIAAAVDAWLDEHPEATTTVQDDSLTTAKYQDRSVTGAKLAMPYWTWAADGTDARLAVHYEETE